MRYLGNKEKLLFSIHSLLFDKELLKSSLVFCDAFCGSGSVSNSLKSIYNNIIINDSMVWNVIYSQGRIMASKCKFEKLGFNPFNYFKNELTPIKGFFYNNYTPGGSERMYFTPKNGEIIDGIRYSIENWKKKNLISDIEYAYLLYCLIEAISKVSNTAGVYGSYLKYWDRRALKTIDLHPLTEDLFNDSSDYFHLETKCCKIEDVISEIKCDILYLDPPYTQNQYGTQYHLLETLILNDNPTISKITGSRPVTPMKSYWSKDISSHILFDKIIAKTNARHIILSYNNDGLMSKDYIESVLKRYGNEETYECREITYKKYNNTKCKTSQGHIEYLFYVEKKEEKDIIFESPLNYSGNKAKMMPMIKSLLPENIDVFVDVFGGGFNVGVNISANKIIYNDINNHVVNLLKSFADIDSLRYYHSVMKLITDYELSPNNKEGYLKIREIYNNTPESKRSPIMLYTLILYSFQQQIRFNSHHDFNLPCGSRYFNDRLISKFISFMRKIKNINVEFINNNFSDLDYLIKKNVFFYLDPPYRETTATYNDGKRGYEGWNILYEQKLCSFIDKINDANSKFIFSYLLESHNFTNFEIEHWAQERGYSIIPVGEKQGRYNNRKEVLIKNY